MKLIRISLNSNELSSLLHDCVYISGQTELSVSGFLLSKEQIRNNNLGKPIFSQTVPDQCMAEIKNGLLTISSSPQNKVFLSLPNPAQGNVQQNISSPLLSVLLIKAKSGHLVINAHKDSGFGKSYAGQLMIIAEQNKMRLVLHYPLEDYVQSVLRGEVPEKYHIEAIKAQAICARTYGLHPRVDHSNDFCDVCDSYQCCQCFVGIQEKKNSPYALACEETNGQILSYEDKLALALFSSSAGGHTENYEDCFSDWKTGIFPAKPIPYLRGVSENIVDKQVNRKVDENALKTLWQMSDPPTIDGWSKNFRWSVKLSAEDLESHIHNNIALLLEQRNFAPFIVPPPSGIFAEILSFSILKRGMGGTAITLSIRTSKGNWEFTKELTIRSLFRNPAKNLKRLSSAKVYFDQIRDNKEHLVALNIYGLGAGHGVGLQQIGAEGLARSGKHYRQILAHYYKDIVVEKI